MLEGNCLVFEAKLFLMFYVLKGLKKVLPSLCAAVLSVASRFDLSRLKQIFSHRYVTLFHVYRQGTTCHASLASKCFYQSPCTKGYVK